MSETATSTDYEKPELERFGTFRDLTQLTNFCDSPLSVWTYACEDGPSGGRS